jgi:hypothetical protein
MKKYVSILIALLLALSATPLVAPAQNQAQLHYVAGVWVSSVYNQYRATVFGGPYASGAGTIIVYPARVSLPDGYTFNPFSTANPIIVGAGTPNGETVTPSAVSSSPCPSGVPATAPCEYITATFANAHGQGDSITSGSSGLDEALKDAGDNGGGMVFYQVDTGIVPLATGATTTTLCTSCIPAGFLMLSAVARVTTTITSACTGWELGDGTTAARFTTNNTNLTAGTVSFADLQTTSGVASTSTGMLAAASKSLVSTCAGGNPGAGALHVRISGYMLATPNS